MGDLYRIYLTSQRDGMEFNLAYIPRSFDRKLNEPFETAYMKALFEALRWRHPHGVKGLNSNYTALYARRLLDAHPQWASVIEVRRRRSP